MAGRLERAGCHNGSGNLPGARFLAKLEEQIRQGRRRSAAKVVAGYQPVMPTFQGQLSEEQLIALAAYVRSLPPPDVLAVDVPPPAVKAGRTGSR